MHTSSILDSPCAPNTRTPTPGFAQVVLQEFAECSELLSAISPIETGQQKRSPSYRKELILRLHFREAPLHNSHSPRAYIDSRPCIWHLADTSRLFRVESFALSSAEEIKSPNQAQLFR